MKLIERITDVITAIGNDMKKTIQKTADGKYPALDGSNITNLVLQIKEVNQDPTVENLVNGKIWLLRTQKLGGIIEPHGLTPMFSNKVDKVDLKIKTSKGVGVINITY